MKRAKLVSLSVIFILAISSFSSSYGDLIILENNKQQANPTTFEQQSVATLTKDFRVQVDESSYQFQSQEVSMSLTKKPIIQHTTKLAITEQMTVSNNDGSDSQIYLLKHNDNQAILERITNQRKFKLEKILDMPAVALASHAIGSQHDGSDDFGQTLPRIQNLASLDVSLIELQPFINFILMGSILDNVENIRYDNLIKHQYSLLFVFAVAAFYIIVQSEKPKIQIQNYNRVLSLVLVSILLSSTILTPISVSQSYWPNEVYAQVSDQTPQTTETTSETTSSESPPTDSQTSDPVMTTPPVIPNDTESTDIQPMIFTNATTQTNSTQTDSTTQTNSTQTDSTTQTNSTQTDSTTQTNSTQTDSTTQTNSTQTDSTTQTNSTQTDSTTQTNSTQTDSTTQTNSTQTDSTTQIVEPEPVNLLNQTSVSGTLDTNSTEYVIVPTVTQTSQITLSVWVTPQYDGASDELTVLSKENSFVLSLNNIISPEHTAKFSVFDGIRWTEIQGTDQIREKSHIVAVINGTEISLYVNGTIQAKQTIQNSFAILQGELDTTLSQVANSESDIVIGAHISTLRSQPELSNMFSGIIEETLVYPRALSESEIEQLYHPIPDLLEAQNTIILTVEPILNQTKSSYLINEDIEFQLQYYDDYEALAKQIQETRDELPILLQNTEQNLTQIETQMNGTEESFQGTDNIVSAVIDEITNTKEQIQILEETIAQINPDSQSMSEIKTQIGAISENLKSINGNITDAVQSEQIDTLAETLDGMITENATIQYEKWQDPTDTITAEIYDPQGILIDTISEFEKTRDGEFNIKLSPEDLVTPGVYHIKTILYVDGEQFILEDEFAWGLVSLNTKKSIYKPGETADFVIVVLDNGGHPVCDSNLVMTITDPQLQKTVLSSNDGITANQECGLYDSSYLTNIEGNYTTDITAQTPDGTTSFSTYFAVKQNYDYDIIRTAQSKIDPITNPNSFNVTINIESFVGPGPITIQEFIPTLFNVTTDGIVQNIDGTKILTWEKSLIENKTSISYTYSIPLVFPKLYALGKVQVTQNNSTFTEARNWYVAADPLNTIVSLTESLGIVDTLPLPEIGAKPARNLGMADDLLVVIGNLSPVLLTENLGITSSEVLQATVPLLLTENLGLADTATRSIPKSISENLGLADTATRSIPKSISENLGLADTATRSIPQSLSENLGLADTATRSIPQSISENLGLADTATRSIPQSLSENLGLSDVVLRSQLLTENLGLSDTITKSITKPITENLGLADTATRSIPKSLSENLGLADTATRSIPQSLSENLGLADTATRSIPQSISENLGLADTATRSIPKSLSENLGLSDVVLRSQLLTENLGLSDTITKSITKPITENLGLADTATRSIPKSLSENLGLADTATRSIPKSISENLGLDDDVITGDTQLLTENLGMADTITKSITKPITENLGLSDTITRSILKSLSENLGLADTVITGKTQSLSENLGLADTVTKSITKPITENLGLSDTITRSILKSLSENLGLADTVITGKTQSLSENLGLAHTTTTPAITRPLSENLGMSDTATRSITKSLSESLGLADTATPSITKLFTENLGLAHTTTTPAITKSLKENLGLNNTLTWITNLAANQVLISNVQTSAAANNTNTQLVILDINVPLETITVASNITSSLNYTRIRTVDNEILLKTGPTIVANITTARTGNDVEISFPDTTKITGPSDWNEVIQLPSLSATITAVDSSSSTSGTTTTTTSYTDVTAIEIGLLTGDLAFNETVSITFLGNGGGQGFVGFVKLSGGSITVLSQCTGSTLTAGQACYRESGANLIIDTTHFTAIGSAKATTSSSSTASSGGGGGGGRGGGGGGGAGIAGQAGIGGKSGQLVIYEISYDTCEKNTVRIIVGAAGTNAASPNVKIRTSEKVYAATLAQDQPYTDVNKVLPVSRYVYEAPMSSSLKYFIVTAEQVSARTAQSTSYLADIDQCRKTIAVNSMKDIKASVSEPIIEAGKPNIFDIKLQIKENKPIKAATTNKFVELGTPVKITAIVDSSSILRKAELRVVTAGGNHSNYATVTMKIVPLNTTNTYLVSAELPTLFLKSPAIVYWITVTNNDKKVQTSEEYYLGVKPTYKLQTEIKLDSLPSKAQGLTYRPTAFVYNNGPFPLLGSVSLLVDGTIVYTSAEQLFGEGQSEVDLKWMVPKLENESKYDISARLYLYDNIIDTTKTTLVTFQPTKLVPISKPIVVSSIMDSEKMIARAVLLYSSDTNTNLHYRVVAPDGTCIIGKSNACMVKDSTVEQRGNNMSIELDGQIYRIRYSGQNSPLERFSITSINPIVGNWNVTLESDDGLIPDANAIKDVYLKIKYRST